MNVTVSIAYFSLICKGFDFYSSQKANIIQKTHLCLGRQKCVFCWWTRGESLLHFPKHFGIHLRLCFGKCFGHRSKTLPRSLFSLRSTPVPFVPTNKKTPTWVFFVGGPEGSRTPVRKSVDITFSVGSRSIRFPHQCRRRTGNSDG